MCFVWIWEQTAIILLYYVNRLLKPSIQLPHPTYTTYVADLQLSYMFQLSKKPQESERQTVALQFELCAVVMPTVQVDKMAGGTAALCECRSLVLTSKLG
jgi:hypothetical protein